MSNTMPPQGPWLLPDYDPDPVSDRQLLLLDVWVHLELLCPRPLPERRRLIIDGLDFTGKVPGLLQRWLRSGDGAWLGLVNYEVGYIDGRSYKYRFDDQLVPAWALSKREDPPRPP